MAGVKPRMTSGDTQTEGFTLLQFPHEHGEFTVLPARGRVYGLDYKGTEAIWRPEVIEGWNIGGDRLWIAPERDWHWTDVTSFDLDNYKVAAEIDPGSWEIAEQSEDALTVAQSFRVQHRRKPAYVEGELRRQFKFNSRASHTMPGLEDAISWSTIDSLEVQGGTSGQGIGMWRILQVHTGGEIFVPSPAPDRYRLHFGDEFGLVSQSGGGLTAAITGNQMYKIGMGKDAVGGSIAYARPLTQDRLLVIARWFATASLLPYLDTPMDRPGTSGDVIQIYNDNGVFGGFGELEVHSAGLHVPAEGEAALKPRAGELLETCVGTMTRSDWQRWKEGRRA